MAECNSASGDRPIVIRRPTERDFYGRVRFTVEWRGREIRVDMPGDVLDDLDRAKHRTPEEVVTSFERHRHAILEAVVVAASDGDRFRPGGEQAMLQLILSDFQALSP